MDIQQYIAADKELLLNLNGSQSLFWDGFMWVATSTIVWVPVAAMLLYIIIKNNKIQEALLTIVMIALVITLADQIASGLCKPFFARFRPTQDPNIEEDDLASYPVMLPTHLLFLSFYLY